MADSPFVATARRLEALVGALDPRAQALFFCCAARALLADRADDVDDVLAAAQEFALAGRVPDEIPQMLAALKEQQTTVDEVDLVAQDALICADIALRITYGAFNARDGVWYVLEPQFQATSERLFGCTDGKVRASRSLGALMESSCWAWRQTVASPRARRGRRAPKGAAIVESDPGASTPAETAAPSFRDRYSDRVLSRSRCPGVLSVQP